MQHWIYVQPESCQVGEKYYLKQRTSREGNGFQEVQLIGYRPHPGELNVRDARGPRKIYRLDLYQKVSRE